MNLFHFVALQCCVTALVLSAPLPDRPVTVAHPNLTPAVNRARTLVVKILDDVRVVHQATVHVPGLTLPPSSETPKLQMMVSSLGISAPPTLMALSAQFTLEDCLSRMSVGIQLHKDLLGALASKLQGLDDLQADLRDLHTQITEMQALGGWSHVETYQSPDLAARLQDDYKTQIASHLTLTQLRAFCHDMVRSLRNISAPAP